MFLSFPHVFNILKGKKESYLTILDRSTPGGINLWQGLYFIKNLSENVGSVQWQRC